MIIDQIRRKWSCRIEQWTHTGPYFQLNNHCQKISSLTLDCSSTREPFPDFLSCVNRHLKAMRTENSGRQFNKRSRQPQLFALLGFRSGLRLISIYVILLPRITKPDIYHKILFDRHQSFDTRIMYVKAARISVARWPVSSLETE